MKRLKLSEVFPDWMSGDGIFNYLTGAPWSDDVTADTLNLDYHGNFSFDKYASNLVLSLLDDGALTELGKQKLGGLIKAKFNNVWAKRYATLSIEYNPLTNFDVTDTETPNITENESHNLSYVESPNITKTFTPGVVETNELHDKSVRKPDLVTETNVETNIVESDSTDSDNKHYGFNTQSAVPVNSGSSGVLHTTEGSADENITTNKEQGIEENETNTDTVKSFTGSNMNTEIGTTTSTDNGSITKTETGVRIIEHNGFRAIYGMQSKQTLLKEERDTWIFDFFYDVYKEIDSVLCLPIW